MTAKAALRLLLHKPISLTSPGSGRSTLKHTQAFRPQTYRITLPLHHMQQMQTAHRSSTHPEIAQHAYLELDLDDFIVDCVLSRSSNIADGTSSTWWHHNLVVHQGVLFHYAVNVPCSDSVADLEAGQTSSNSRQVASHNKGEV